MKLFTVLAALTLIAAPAHAAVSPEYDAGFGQCYVSKNTIVPHSEGYNDGKLMALAVNEAVANGVNGVKPHRIKLVFLTKRTRFPSIATLVVQNQSGDELAGCMSAKWMAFKSSAWSSVHAGLVDYLTPDLKAHFFSIPER